MPLARVGAAVATVARVVPEDVDSSGLVASVMAAVEVGAEAAMDEATSDMGPPCGMARAVALRTMRLTDMICSVRQLWKKRLNGGVGQLYL